MLWAGLDWGFSVFSFWAVLLAFFIWPMLFQSSDIIPFMTFLPSSTETLNYTMYPHFMKFTGYHSTYHIFGSEVEKLAFNTVERGIKMPHIISLWMLLI